MATNHGVTTENASQLDRYTPEQLDKMFAGPARRAVMSAASSPERTDPPVRSEVIGSVAVLRDMARVPDPIQGATGIELHDFDLAA